MELATLLKEHNMSYGLVTEVEGVEELIPFGSRIISWGNDQEILTVRCWSALGRRTHRVPVTSSDVSLGNFKPLFIL